MTTELDKAKARLTHGRLALEGQKAHETHVPAKGYSPVRSKKLIEDMDRTIAGMKEYLATLDKSSH